MDNRYILSSFFLDEPLPELKSLATEDWVVNAPPCLAVTNRCVLLRLLELVQKI